MDIWSQCVKHLEGQLSPQQFNNWIRPLQIIHDSECLRLLAPNQFVLNWVKKNYLADIRQFVIQNGGESAPEVVLSIGSKARPHSESGEKRHANVTSLRPPRSAVVTSRREPEPLANNLNSEFTFDSFVQGKSNQLARAASMQIGDNPGTVYNPLFIYGGVGLGKTHLMHAVGNKILENSPDARVVYLHSEGFVAEMVKALQHGTIEAFKRRYRSVNALLIDDVQFFAGKERSQEEFFHTFNALFESRQQIILSSDRFPKEVHGLEERLKSRFGWGLTVAIEPPDLETRVAILKSKAMQLFHVDLPNEVAFFIGKRFRSNIRDLEGALRRIIANAEFTGRTITQEFAQDSLRDMLAAQDKQVTIENIQKTVAEYFKIRHSDLLSSKRSRTIARPRQIAMTLAKELTGHSLPEIGEAFGGRDHTTVLYATRKIAELKESDNRVAEDYANLLRTLSS
ncbi:MAG: chromosomal replication initiator protein DnaA [Candidatus Sedimenticola endophacoides]|uniref:Chromosomal replication initiator protein DnaA n=1 Tax=Candidatus Sedimenticola endophacoides TaxID=2548426 RepID=A0A6N4DRT1_9GAMM|nr:MAG: chromosomal replication initiation protein DnaA [Candidatus Sedimenticola endophacoides]OQX36109.1 MAG: chromosomal replication initiation protein DnaA [Candidatus Sedimenticola endophacoides]OQX48693.1 MAG: chromosomal replication initiation protein DnaA [Candidatus Sedimenticola endophacoides]PUD99050.1 MAG: chromosomal replication initiator protein DnaA [Candidatus Sedimenticola endophacoides]PUE02516.1 MAG: chromosomal replication initiator protein DnaA [Candidatus Sedimenticola end